MANQEHLDLLKQSVEIWNQWRQKHPDIRPDFDGADLVGADLSGAYLHDAHLIRTDLVGADLSGAYLRDAHLTGANLAGAYLCNANLSGANLSGANLGTAEFSGFNLLGIAVVQTLRGTYDNEKDRERDLDFLYLHELDTRVNLSGANLSGANLSGTNLYRTLLNGVNLSGANLREATLIGANLREADLSKARLWRTAFAENDLSVVKGLATVIHDGPSFVDVKTVVLPQGVILKSFLRGTGFPDTFIDNLPSLLNTPIQYQSCFISYSSKDDRFAKKLYTDLQESGVRCWFAPEDMKIGDKIRTRIDEAIHLQDKLLLLLSEHALASSWVEDEVEAALEKEQKQQQEVLFPVHLDESVMQTTQAWAAKLRRTRHIGDFTRWTDPQAYQIAFDRLLRDLKAQP